MEDVIEAMDRAGVDLSVLVNIGWSDHGLCRETNDYLLAAAARYPKRLAVFCGVNPSAGKEAVQEIARCAGLGALGVGELHPDYQGYSLSDVAVMRPVMEAAAHLGLVVLTHASEPVGHEYPGKGAVTPDILYRFIVAFPESPIILAHWGGGLPFYALMPEVRKSLANVYFDSAASPFLYEASIFEKVVSLVGAERVLFATDYPLITQERLLLQVQEAGLTSRARDRILGGNAAALLRLDGSGGS
ncbi:MAG: metal-dependent hydrolase-like protein [Dehalococcoidia bacterium]|nr:metal-dependent hydrolase-like protein [Dehalococcoidia bacterium]